MKILYKAFLIIFGGAVMLQTTPTPQPTSTPMATPEAYGTASFATATDLPPVATATPLPSCPVDMGDVDLLDPEYVSVCGHCVPGQVTPTIGYQLPEVSIVGGGGGYSGGGGSSGATITTSTPASATITPTPDNSPQIYVGNPIYHNMQMGVFMDHYLSWNARDWGVIEGSIVAENIVLGMVFEFIDLSGNGYLTQVNGGSGNALDTRFGANEYGVPFPSVTNNYEWSSAGAYAILQNNLGGSMDYAEFDQVVFDQFGIATWPDWVTDASSIQPGDTFYYRLFAWYYTGGYDWYSGVTNAKVYPIYYGIPSAPVEPTATPTESGAGVPVVIGGAVDCSVPFYRDDTPVVEYSGFQYESTTCYTFIPGVHVDLKPISGVWDGTDLEVPQVELCLEAYSFPEMVLVGLPLPLDYLTIALITLLLFFIARL